MKTHLETTCTKVYLKCKTCNVAKMRGDLGQDRHKCDVEQLKIDNKLLKVEVM